MKKIHGALQKDHFCLYAQRIDSLGPERECSYELLVRMLDEQGQIVPPLGFLPAAERYKLTSDIDRWVIDTALKQLAGQRSFLQQINYVAINLSGQSLADDKLLGFILSRVAADAVLARKLYFEITETAAISHLGNAKEFIATLKNIGCRFSLDDSGSGLSSFAYLKNLPADHLKIDGLFVKDIVEDKIDRAMVKSINEIAQGYGISAPLPFDELLRHADSLVLKLPDKLGSTSSQAVSR